MGEFDPKKLDRKTRRALRGTFRADMETRGNLARALLSSFIALGIVVALGLAAYMFFKGRHGH